jgi:hypothetical protein
MRTFMIVISWRTDGPVPGETPSCRVRFAWDGRCDDDSEDAMLIVFCSDPLEPARPDRALAAEIDTTERMGLPHVLVDHDALVRGDEPGRVVRRVPDRPEVVLAAYRGWMVTPPQYRVLHEALAAKGIRLINDPDRYRHAHELPESGPTPPIERFLGIAAVRSRFFAMDLARRRDGGWMIVEIGDGRVSGLPRESDADPRKSWY